MIPLAHILGVPVEETAGMFAPVAAVTMGALSASILRRWRNRPGGRERVRTRQ
jgi:hypothetical protein